MADEKYTPPKSAQESAKKVLKWKEEHGDEVKAMTPTGWARARQLASGEGVSKDIVERMANFYRHKKNSTIKPEYKAEPWKDNGYVAYEGWGGDSGIEWARGLVKKWKTARIANRITIRSKDMNIRLGYKPVISAKDLKSLTKKAESIADKKIEMRIESDRKVQKAIEEISRQIEAEYREALEKGEEPDLDDIKKKVLRDKDAKKAVKGAIVDGAIDAGEAATGKKAGGTVRRLLRIFLLKAIPMGIFGFIDNIIMILAGNYIDSTIAQALGIGTMAAAGIGNATSDAVGVMGQDRVDAILNKFGLGEAEDERGKKLTKMEQVVGMAGGVFGIVVGCIVGMFPLLMTGSKHEEDERIARIANRITNDYISDRRQV
jgi:hypothetical protein